MELPKTVFFAFCKEISFWGFFFTPRISTPEAVKIQNTIRRSAAGSRNSAKSRFLLLFPTKSIFETLIWNFIGKFPYGGRFFFTPRISTPEAVNIQNTIRRPAARSRNSAKSRFLLLFPTKSIFETLIWILIGKSPFGGRFFFAPKITHPSALPTKNRIPQIWAGSMKSETPPLNS